jgi:hypothetical protein
MVWTVILAVVCADALGLPIHILSLFHLFGTGTGRTRLYILLSDIP